MRTATAAEEERSVLPSVAETTAAATNMSVVVQGEKVLIRDEETAAAEAECRKWITSREVCAILPSPFSRNTTHSAFVLCK